MFTNEKEFMSENFETDYNINHKEFIELSEPDMDMEQCVDENNNFIHPMAIVSPGVKLGKNNYIGAFCRIVGKTVIGDNNHFEAYCSIGSFPEWRDYFNYKKCAGLVIGNNNVFREYITINAGALKDTVLRNNICMLRGSHVGHDSRIEDNVTLSCNVLIGGHSIVMQGANMGLASVCHQKSLIGPYSMIGMHCTITHGKAIEPFGVYVGTPCRKLKDFNSIAVQRAKITDEGIKHLNELYSETYKEVNLQAHV